MKLRLLCLVGIIPLLSSCFPDRRVAPAEYELTKDDRLAIQKGISSMVNGRYNAELTTARAHEINGAAVVRMCGSFVPHDANWRPIDQQTYLVAGILSYTKEGRRTFDVSSLDKYQEEKSDRPVSDKPTTRRLHHIICSE